MTYASYDDLVTRFGETKLTPLTDRATPLARVPDRGVIEAALADATETIDGYAAGRYLTPLSPVPAPVLRGCADMAFYYLHTGTGKVPDDVRKMFEDALAGLKDMSKGVIVFRAEGVPAANVPGGGSIKLDAPARIFTPESLKGF